MGRPLGQHFLFQHSILARIAEAACPQQVGLCIEIGPGPGGLTEFLHPRAKRLIAVELDSALAAKLRERYTENPTVEIVQGDVLSTNLSQWGPATVCGNLPYYITSPIIEQVLAMGPALERAVFLVQKEVADRLAAPSGNRDYGYLSVATQLFCTVERLFLVKPASFRPPPKVDSAVVRLTPRTSLPVADTKAFLRFASACFRQKRKTLRNNLSAHYPPEKLTNLPEAGLRAEQLSLPELIRLFGVLNP
ncbi:16S rRNA (adenine(1518)-N(6)/adenine(1519)-N(6))-dimethyltransferase RsmA [Paludibaculum fermentans]|uniref:Ribosomal RNA small subunit methyltransferase A n=1 Tax=Paludibaculum fermentans TaxID=1473598 RepID=A0A7S7NNV5_PALFE|nr:16S rRNA (adenine(1518)-N(6)/adenine(1519)-N(6))-dimethyltransferase RsmA [Paludibaculum fermentans]QOY87078.1 ribosomal RNA small subunit methyltransferase A [Paludibaculum fermentans]